MSYATTTQFTNAWGSINTNLAETTQTFLDKATAKIDNFLLLRRRKSDVGALESQTWTNFVFRIRDNHLTWASYDPARGFDSYNLISPRYMYWPVWPVVGEPEGWSMSITSLLVNDMNYNLIETIDVSTLVMDLHAYEQGLVLLSTTNLVRKSDYLKTTFTGGYSTVPDVLVEACLLEAMALVEERLDRDPTMDPMTSKSGKFMSMDAQEMLAPYVMRAIV